MIKSAWIGALILSTVTPSFASAQSYLMSIKTKALAQSYRDCVISEAAKLEPAGETAHETVEAAKTACDKFRFDIALSVTGDVQEKFPQTPVDGRTQLSKQSREFIEDQVTKSAKLAIIRQRAEKK